MKKHSIVIILLGIAVGVGVWLWLYKTTSEDVVELDADKQKFIWDAEHITFELESYFGKPFAKALKERDDDAIRNLANKEFSAVLLDETPNSKRSVASFDEVKWISKGSGAETDIEGFIKFFRQKLERFKKIERSKLRVIKIRQVEGDPYAWNAELLVTSHGRTEDNNPITFSSHHKARFRYETDEEIRSGGTLVKWVAEDFTTSVTRLSFFNEITKESGLLEHDLPDNWFLPTEQVQTMHSQIAVEDFDRDGDLDIAVATLNGRPYLLCYEEGKFIDRGSEMGLKEWEPMGPERTSLAGWLDFDNDGYPDLVLGKYLYKNFGGLRFKDVTEESGFSAGYQPHGMTVADYDCDGLLDIYVSYGLGYNQQLDKAGWVGDESGGTANILWKNIGKGKFKDVTESANASGGAKTTFTSSWFFYDDDHYPDLYIANDFTKNVVLRNKGNGTFEDISAQTVAADFATSMGVDTGDVNNDGQVDIYVANMFSKMGRRIIDHVSEDDYPEGIYSQILGSCLGNRLYSKGADGNYVDVTDIAGVNEVGWAFAPVLCDFDGDGLLDIYATTGFMSFSRTKPDG